MQRGAILEFKIALCFYIDLIKSHVFTYTLGE